MWENQMEIRSGLVIFSTVCFFNQQNVGNCLQDLLELTSPKDVLFIIGHWNAKVGSQ